MSIYSFQLSSTQLNSPQNPNERPLKVTGWVVPPQQQQNRPGGDQVSPSTRSRRVSKQQLYWRIRSEFGGR